MSQLSAACHYMECINQISALMTYPELPEHRAFEPDDCNNEAAVW